jgi:hypothetical protein
MSYGFDVLDCIDGPHPTRTGSCGATARVSCQCKLQRCSNW